VEFVDRQKTNHQDEIKNINILKYKRRIRVNAPH